VKLRLLEDVQLEGHLIPRNSFFYLPPFALDFPDFLTCRLGLLVLARPQDSVVARFLG
jgi:hypothetical protein